MEHRDRSIAAEVRAVEEGHQARLNRDVDGVFVRIVSDTVHGRWYRVTAHAPAGEHCDIVWTCRPSDLHQQRGSRSHGLVCSNDGTTGCKHQALAARRLERAGLVRWVDPHVADGIAYAGRWVAARATRPLVLDELAEPERKATGSQGYRSTVGRLDPETAQAFASFGQADQR